MKIPVKLIFTGYPSAGKRSSSSHKRKEFAVVSCKRRVIILNVGFVSMSFLVYGYKNTNYWVYLVYLYGANHTNRPIKVKNIPLRVFRLVLSLLYR